MYVNFPFDKILRSIILSTLANFGIFIFLFLINDLASQFHQYTPDTYVYEFIARAVGSPEGLIGLDAGWLLLRGIVLPSVLTVFFPNFEPWILPFVIYIFLFLLFIYFSLQSINNTRKHKSDFYQDVLIATLIFSIFLVRRSMVLLSLSMGSSSMCSGFIVTTSRIM